jgi:hypothetical protein
MSYFTRLIGSLGFGKVKSADVPAPTPTSEPAAPEPTRPDAAPDAPSTIAGD